MVNPLALCARALARAALLTAALGAGCTPSVAGVGPGDNSDGGGVTCTRDQITCADNQTAAVCVTGQLSTRQSCQAPLLCGEGLGCVQCLPAQGTTCVGAEVHACNPDGKIGALSKTCPMGCMGGQCLGSGSCGAAGVDLIYVVDKTYRLLSFDPRNNAHTFRVIGSLACKPGPSLRGGAATPLSMSVDRTGRAFVLYTSGEIFWVSTADASCQRSPFVSGQAGFKYFGMGFVSDAEGTEAETLFIGGGDTSLPSTGALGRVPVATLVPTRVGDLANSGYPELTGTGKGELYAYFPGPFSPRVQLLNKSTAATTREWKLTASANMVTSYAFAHWGGVFYIFQSTTDNGGQLTSKVLRFNPADGTATPVVNNSPYQVVGAGVSTCAPVILG